jgi:hypothetical protein
MHELALLLQTMSNPPNPEVLGRMMLMVVPIILIFYVIAIALIMVPCWFILKKAGFSPWLALLCLLPSLGTLVLLYVLAFAEWKVIPAPQAVWPPPAPYPPPPAAPQA